MRPSAARRRKARCARRNDNLVKSLRPAQALVTWIERAEDVAGGQYRHVVLGRATAEQQRDPQPLDHVGASDSLALSGHRRRNGIGQPRSLSRSQDAVILGCAEALAAHLDAHRSVAVICEGDPLFYGSYMHLHVRLASRYPTEVIAGVTGMSGCWSAVGAPIAQGDDVFTVLPGTLPEEELERRLRDADAAVIMKLGRNLPKVRRALARSGHLARAMYVERGTMKDAVVVRLADKADDCAPYFAVVLVPGWEGRS